MGKDKSQRGKVSRTPKGVVLRKMCAHWRWTTFFGLGLPQWGESIGTLPVGTGFRP